jgi:hypothetical protein
MGPQCRHAIARPTQGGGMNPFDMGKMMESVKKAQAIVQEESQKMQAELAR